jgi:putative Mg2+ transporter-C (MgtC) family protein
MDIWTFLINVLVSMICGLVIGLERQCRQHAAGLRTHALICVGAALYASLSLLLIHDTSPSRIASQIVTGIGFLGGGVILRDGMTVKGLTTAATIWVSGAVGTLAGCGYLLFAVVGTLVILFLNGCMHPFSEWLDRQSDTKRQDLCYRLSIQCSANAESQLRILLVQFFTSHPRMILQSLAKQESEKPGFVRLTAELFSRERGEETLEDLMARLQLEPRIIDSRWERLS